jgi:hypothetical protein
LYRETEELRSFWFVLISWPSGEKRQAAAKCVSFLQDTEELRSFLVAPDLLALL